MKIRENATFVLLSEVFFDFDTFPSTVWRIFWTLTASGVNLKHYFSELNDFWLTYLVKSQGEQKILRTKDENTKGAFFDTKIHSLTNFLDLSMILEASITLYNTNFNHVKHFWQFLNVEKQRAKIWQLSNWVTLNLWKNQIYRLFDLI